MIRDSLISPVDPSPTNAEPIRPRPETPFRSPHWVWLKRGGLGWWVRQEWGERLIGPSGLRLAEWQAENRLSTVKTGPLRTVYRAELPTGTVYIKHFQVPSWREVLRQWFRRGKGRNEGKRATHLACMGISTINPIALGEFRRKKFLFENYLVTQGIDHAIPLDQFLEEVLPGLPLKRRTHIRQRVAFELARLCARLHDSRFLHIDFHPGNILISLSESDEVEFAMIDLDALRRRRRLSWNMARSNLALLNHYFWTRSERSDRYRFLREYLSLRAGEGPDLESFSRGIEQDTRTWAERLWRRWGRRCCGTNKYFKRYSHNHCWTIASRDVSRDLVRKLMQDPDAPFRDPETVLIKDSRTTTVAALVLEIGGQPTPVIYKRFNRKKWLDPIYAFFRRSRGFRAWQNGQHLTVRGVPTPRNLIFISQSSTLPRLLPHQFSTHVAYLVTAKEEPATTLGEFVECVLPHCSPGDQRRAIQAIIPALARLLRTLHERSLSHRDLKASNILIIGDPWATPPSLSLIDLVGVALEHPITRHHQVQNLARLQLSLGRVVGRTRTDSLRFLRVYLPWGQTRTDAWKQLWREIDRAGVTKVERNLRNGRRLS
jgi:tRNA A-37 threonylcarbamoyl transferase component Bud32